MYTGEPALGAHLEELELDVEMIRFLNENRLRLDSRIRVVRINGPSQSRGRRAEATHPGVV